MFTVFFYDQYTRFITSHVRSARYCDQHAYLSVCLSVCLFMNIIFGFVWSLSTFTDYIYLLTYFFLSQKPDVQTIHQIVCACHVAVVRSSCISALWYVMYFRICGRRHVCPFRYQAKATTILHILKVTLHGFDTAASIYNWVHSPASAAT